MIIIVINDAKKINLFFKSRKIVQFCMNVKT